ncbi:hypothetical protein NFI96_013064, partial [Prochilodus magdalenae]
MGKSKEISQDIRKRIVDLHKSGSSLGAISRCLKVPRSSVQTIICKYKKDGNVQPSYRSGRKKVLCPRDERALVRSVHINPRAKAKDLVNMMAEADYLSKRGLLYPQVFVVLHFSSPILEHQSTRLSLLSQVPSCNCSTIE